MNITGSPARTPWHARSSWALAARSNHALRNAVVASVFACLLVCADFYRTDHGQGHLHRVAAPPVGPLGGAAARHREGLPVQGLLWSVTPGASTLVHRLYQQYCLLLCRHWWTILFAVDHRDHRVWWCTWVFLCLQLNALATRHCSVGRLATRRCSVGRLATRRCGVGLFVSTVDHLGHQAL